MLPLKNSLTSFYAKFMTLFDVFYSNLLRSEIVRVFYAKFRTHLRCFSSRFTLESARARTRARSAARDFHAVILGPVCCYKTDIGFTLNFVLIYAVLAHVLRSNPPEPEPRTIGCTLFSRRNFGLRLLLQNRYRIYAKFRTHLRCFTSRFTLKSGRAKTRTRSCARGYT
jgi:hypothetical protein